MVISKYMKSFSISVRQTTALYDETLLHISAKEKKKQHLAASLICVCLASFFCQSCKDFSAV